MRKSILLGVISLFGVFGVQADSKPNGALTIDRTVIGASELNFPNDKKIYPRVSDFEVLNFVLMSSEAGERWATVTLKNTAEGSRNFSAGQIHALLANGKRTSPNAVKRMFAPGQILTIPLSFGKSKFPLLEIYTRTR